MRMHQSFHLKTFDLLCMNNTHIPNSNTLIPKLVAYYIFLFGEMRSYETTEEANRIFLKAEQ